MTELEYLESLKVRVSKLQNQIDVLPDKVKRKGNGKYFYLSKQKAELQVEIDRLNIEILTLSE